MTYRYVTMLALFVILYLVIYLTNRGIKKGLKVFFEKENKKMPKLPNKSLALVISAVVSFFTSSAIMQKIMLATSNASFGIQDPIFGLDISYYMFLKTINRNSCLIFCNTICMFVIIYGIILCYSI